MCPMKLGGGGVDGLGHQFVEQELNLF